MKIKIERNQKEKSLKKKKERVVSVGKHRKMVLAFWLLLSCSLTFGVYKNFTAIDQHTTHEKVVIKEKVVNTSGIENFTKDFSKEYFSWKNNKEAIEKRMNNLEQYLTEEGFALSQDMVRADIPTNSEVQSVKVLDVEKSSEEFVVSFLVEQKITEGKKAQSISSAYRVTIFEDENRNYIVTSLPTMIAKPDRAKYKTKQVENDSKIDAKTTEEIAEFLETFFKLYPSASEKELEYYVENDAMRPINIDLKFSKLEDPVYLQNGKKILVSTKIKYLDNVSKTTSYFQYKLILQKNGNWKIIDVK
ncbi:TPA: conjugal transfer protein [Enterococcus faecium]|uniref:conjugal transfer protein n=1 Tax=Enterococcus faecium TaxID=1352 RepID=UPI00033053DF|nr:conjugal transfer protein [Enterococcus faecium]EOG07678.1 conjugative transposon protein [Enterococcus faecium EnGen0170]EOM21283.1 conjugative transposon protein [Enterococcus faecium EnGen0193]TKM75399.1 conjugal transfer protein [Enterococcus faecium]HAQ0976587.1 conjugal transfer protein [Enterococcus faecium]HBC2542268.1 conjugal transfer protein [Enterococcus faecium]